MGAIWGLSHATFHFSLCLIYCYKQVSLAVSARDFLINTRLNSETMGLFPRTQYLRPWFNYNDMKAIIWSQTCNSKDTSLRLQGAISMMNRQLRVFSNVFCLAKSL
jgi:hypothetical protein